MNEQDAKAVTRESDLRDLLPEQAVFRATKADLIAAANGKSLTYVRGDAVIELRVSEVRER